jgi:HmuY protein
MQRLRSFDVPLPLLGGFALFLVAIAYLIASSLVKRAVPTFDPTPIAAAPVTRPRVTNLAEDTITVDAGDSRAWRFFDFERGSVVLPPDSAGWDLAFRRYHVIAADAVADLGPAAYGSVTRAPSRGYVATIAGRDTVNPAMRRWYDYGMLTHLLEPNGHLYVVRTSDGSYAKMQLLSYYCTGLTAGCVTFRYTYPLPEPLTQGAGSSSPQDSARRRPPRAS